MYCSECGKPAQGKFCSSCGHSLGTAAAGAVAVAEPVHWETEHRYEALMQSAKVRATVERHAGMARKPISGEQFLALASKFMTQGVPIDKIAEIAQPIYASWGIATGKERAAQIEAPVGRVMLRALCSLARHGQTLHAARQGTDGCLFEAVLPSDFRALEGELLVTVRRASAYPESRTEVSAVTKIRGQLFDWGKSRKALDVLFADLQVDPA